MPREVGVVQNNGGAEDHLVRSVQLVSWSGQTGAKDDDIHSIDNRQQRVLAMGGNTKIMVLRVTYGA